MLAFASCERGPAPVDIAVNRAATGLDKVKITVTGYSSGRIEFKADGNPELVAALRKLLAAKDGKWKHNLTNWAPTLLISSPDMRLNLSGNQAVLNIRMHAGDMVLDQFIVPMTAAEYKEIVSTVSQKDP
jgi:hypothetical protein